MKNIKRKVATRRWANEWNSRNRRITVQRVYWNEKEKYIRNTFCWCMRKSKPTEQLLFRCFAFFHYFHFNLLTSGSYKCLLLFYIVHRKQCIYKWRQWPQIRIQTEIGSDTCKLMYTIHAHMLTHIVDCQKRTFDDRNRWRPTKNFPSAQIEIQNEIARLKFRYLLIWFDTILGLRHSNVQTQLFFWLVDRSMSWQTIYSFWYVESTLAFGSMIESKLNAIKMVWIFGNWKLFQQ